MSSATLAAGVPCSRAPRSDGLAPHLSDADIEQLGRDLDVLRQHVLDSLGARDAAYIRRIIRVQRSLELGSRAVLLASAFPPAWAAGTAGLTLAKILDNLEIGHNLLHGQWDWMREPKIHSSSWEWDMAPLAATWKRTHNDRHHRLTNIVGEDDDLGWGVFRADSAQEWTPACLVQPITNLISMCLFQYGIAGYDVGLSDALERRRRGIPHPEGFTEDLARSLAKIRRQLVKDYLIHPLLSGPSFATTFTANLTANLLRNVWVHTVVMCGHLPDGPETFEMVEVPPEETRGEWYLRQMLGTANITGTEVLHLLTGNLSHQIEHHLFPDLPSNRYLEIAPKVRALFRKYGLTYHEGPMPRQVLSAWRKVLLYSLPNHWTEGLSLRNLPERIRLLARLVSADDGDRRDILASLARSQDL